MFRVILYYILVCAALFGALELCRSLKSGSGSSGSGSSGSSSGIKTGGGGAIDVMTHAQMAQEVAKWLS